ncbi:tyrosine-type DNA invertase [Lelliottia nimipressuralis]|uniref:Tyrosine-type recombinase/integrase n=1 Tax=Lelliottia nimipressuralis TaxID=69220 RepID=A0ABD4KIK4_9ENTR|nr:tyrosine-type DNA invertase [Lelliottia nimipressuralis]MBF4180642.1 tyrosine-type recombinase/integrase [Lelliottia nimipressuralis]
MRKFLTRSEVDRLLSSTIYGQHSLRDKCMIQMCFFHGLRVSELCSLRVSDLDFDDELLFVSRLKNGLSTSQPLVKDEISPLKIWINERNTWRGSESEWLFLSQKGRQMSRQQFGNLLKTYGKHAGISVIPHPHMLRHACGYALANLGADTRLIQDYLGHRNIRHTVIYTASNSARFNKIWRN